jgi:tRNA G18 (ribose-2'-O)-methylase SpoU
VQRDRIEAIDDPKAAPYRDVRDAALASRDGLFMAEGRFVVPILLSRASRYRVHSVLGTAIALESVAPQLEAARAAHPSLPVYEASQAVMDEIVGFPIHRGLLAAGVRTPSVDADALLEAEAWPGLVVAVEDLTNHDNLGGVYRNAAAFGAGAVLVTERCCDPLYRKCVRVSMGHALTEATGRWQGGRAGVRALKDLGYTTIALTPRREAVDLSAIEPSASADTRGVALLVGSEGEGLSKAAMMEADVRARIPMAAGVDSLNTATATGIGLWALAGRSGLLTERCRD